MINSFKSLKRMKLMAFLIILQLSISLMLINSTGSIIEGYKSKINGFSSLMNFEKTYLIRLIDPNEFAKTEKSKETNICDYSFEKMIFHSKELNYDLNSIKEEGKIKNIYFNFPFPSVVNSTYLNDKYSDLPPEKLIDAFGGLLVNYDFIHDYNLSISEGRSFTKEDFNVDYKTEAIPIIIGKDFNKLKLNDIVELPNSEINYLLNGNINESIEKYLKSDGSLERTDMTLKFKVIGFYDNNAIPLMYTKSNFIQAVNYSNAYTIVPCIKNLCRFNEDMITRDLGAYIEVNSHADIEFIKNKLEPKLKEKGLELRIIDLSKEYEGIKEPMTRDILRSALLGGIMLILSIIGITSVLLGELDKRKKEFGIRIACGADLKTLCKEMIIEITLMLAMASAISITGMYIKDLRTSIESQLILSPSVILINIFVMAIAIIIISILPILRLRKMNPVDLVRGE